MLNKLKKLDLGIITLLVVFMVFSTLIVRSAIAPDPKFQGYDTRTIIFYVIGFIVLFAVSIFDYRILLRKHWYLYGLGLLSLLLLYPFGSEINGAKSWYAFPGGLQFQPAEMVKIVLILTMAHMLSKRDGDPLRFRSDLIPTAFIALVPFLIVLIQPDLGNAIIYLIILVGMLWIGNTKYTHVLIGITTIVGGLILVVVMFTTFNTQIHDYLESHSKLHWYQRINTFIDPAQASDDDKHQSSYALIAVGSGGLLGDGYMNGQLKNNKFVPYPYSDSIFVVIGEEFGFIGASILLLLYFLLIYRMILIALQCYDRRGSYIIIGIVSMFVFQIFENVGMMIGLMPITGITLPFISYGGTSLLLNMFSIGLVLSIKIYQEKYELE
ncbi:FtsW/RodA/SpoVE family cell cycle protein [Paenibacillus kyungheensis]|uniref:FtsW/RodA/SpoVE family cell cycle protein n=1 Tax=Paenibacillus kyungheensis TaxID=1452732 RepID=A0AAX3LYC4_9BACL|nr:FtsW/RodA/SpoVE family cell cycle protein [Paenibacillus kyungheensis]WCT54904.1 FtsW/RodA/SpoVE family cell cycle protein [Paenibacillus kyungheensis]